MPSFCTGASFSLQENQEGKINLSNFSIRFINVQFEHIRYSYIDLLCSKLLFRNGCVLTLSFDTHIDDLQVAFLESLLLIVTHKLKNCQKKFSYK